MAEHAPVVILYGNHDDPTDIQVYGRLRAPHPITVVTEPAAVSVAGAFVVCVPFPHRRDWLARAGEGPIADQNATAGEALYAWITRALRDLGHRPTVLFGHLNVVGSRVSGDEILADHEVELTREQLDALPVEYVALSHIHLHQQVADRAWYPGSPTAQSFGEREQKGYIIATIRPEHPTTPLVDFRPTPARQLVTVDARWDGVRFEIDDTAIPAGVEVRVRLAVPEEHAGTVPTGELEARFGAEAHRVVVERKLVPLQRVRSAAIQAARTNAERLAAWWETLGAQAPGDETRQRLLGRLALLEAGATAPTTHAHQEAA